jgi:hypothetical protein
MTVSQLNCISLSDIRQYQYFRGYRSDAGGDQVVGWMFCLPDQESRHDEVPHLGKSEKGMVNTEYKLYLARIPKTFATVKLGYSANVYDMVPITARDRTGADPAYVHSVRRAVG